jgi:hypothetical protein
MSGVNKALQVSNEGWEGRVRRSQERREEEGG